ncbi:hypothetical protein LCGC14_0515560 [marine sediment metagenome]|uniref:HTH marR-type domain-containing protein n=1 Tax=marine sediment metagenome TaxID=412755 RepID=A0A0F9ULG5_9ZZZZ|nr:MarR family transcriptional regulator [bacterium]
MIKDEELVHKILENISKLTFLDKRKVFTFEKTKLYPSEIHLLFYIHDGQDKNLTKIAKYIGLTKGAISQTLSRLQKKGVIIKEPDTTRKNELHVTFTIMGKNLMEHVIKVKKTLGLEYFVYVKTLSEDQKELISNFLDVMVTVMDKEHSDV